MPGFSQRMDPSSGIMWQSRLSVGIWKTNIPILIHHHESNSKFMMCSDVQVHKWLRDNQGHNGDLYYLDLHMPFGNTLFTYRHVFD